MQPLNPFLATFFKSPVAAQCTPVHHHILLVPVTDVLLTSRDTESGASAAEIIASEEFLSSHVLRIPVQQGSKDGGHNLRDVRGKAKQFSTLNGRSVVIKDSVVYSNKGLYKRALGSLYNDISAWRRLLTADCGRLQGASSGPDTERLDVVSRCLRATPMAPIFYIPTACWDMGGGQNNPSSPWTE